jgi:glycosyltransferase involved in cell wall biosynthesis
MLRIEDQSMEKAQPRLKVAFINHAGDGLGGAEESLVLFLIQLHLEIDATVVLFEDGRFAGRLRSLGIKTQIVRMSEDVMSTTRERAGIASLLSVPAACTQLFRVLRDGGFNVVVTNSVKAHFIGALAAKIAGIPCVIHMHDILYGNPRRALSVLARALSDERIGCSKAVAAALGVSPVTVINEPLDTRKYDDLPTKSEARKQLGIPDDDLPLVAIIGRINRWKGHDRYVRIAGMVNQKIAARFAIVGSPVFRDADFLPELHRLGADLGITDRLVFIPWLDDPRTIYAAIDLHCNCSYAEPFGRTSTEAAAAGVPTVCFDDGGSAETIIPGVTGTAVPPDDERAFADAVVRYLCDPQALRNASEAARQHRDRFDIESASKTLHAIIRRAAHA